MTPTFLVLHIYKGATFNKVVSFRDDASLPLDLSTFSAQMQIRASIDSPVVILELSTLDGTIELDNLGQMTLKIDAVTTALLPSGFEVESSWVYDVEWTHPDGTVDRPLWGSIVTWPETTRAS